MVVQIIKDENNNYEKQLKKLKIEKKLKNIEYQKRFYQKNKDKLILCKICGYYISKISKRTHESTMTHRRNIKLK